MRVRVDPLDKLVSEYMRKRSGGYCQRCGAYYGWEKLQACHCGGDLYLERDGKGWIKKCLLCCRSEVVRKLERKYELERARR